MAREVHNPWIVHVGAGLPTLGERRTAQLVERIPAGTHYVGVGIGRFWGRAFMKAAAEQTGGYLTQINSDESIPWRALEISSALNSSRLVRLKVSDPSGNETFLNCDDMISAGQEICAVTRIDCKRDLPQSITLSAMFDGHEWKQTLPVANPAKEAGYLPRLWAKLEIDRLVGEDPNRNHDSIVNLSKSMYVMSPFTSLLVLENDAMYAQFNIDRGRKDHWALYRCPDTIEVINEPLAASLNTAPATVAAPIPPATATTKPTARQILRTIVTRPRPVQLEVPARGGSFRFDLDAAAEVKSVTRVYDVRDLIWTQPDFNDAPDFSLTSGSEANAVVVPQITPTPAPAVLPPGATKGLLYDEARRISVQTQEITYQFDQAIADAREALARKDFGAVSADLQRAQVARNQNPNIFTPQALRSYDNQIRQSQLALDTARERAIEESSRLNESDLASRLNVQKARDAFERRSTVKDLQATAMRLTQEARYREAMGVVDQITVLDPTNEYATGVRPLLEDKFNFQQQRLFMQQKDLNYTRQLNAAEEKMIPYDDILRYPADWPDISQTRDQTVQSERGENKQDRTVEAQLDRPLPELTFDAVGFNDVVDFLRDVSGANIFVNWKSLERAGIDRNAPVTAKLRNVKFSKALNIVLDSVGGGAVKLDYTIDNGVISIATAEELAKNTSTRVYDLRDLIVNIPDFNDAPQFSLQAQNSVSGGSGNAGQQGGLFASDAQPSNPAQKGPTRQELVDEIVRQITETVAPDSWHDAGGSIGSIKELSGQLIVTQTPENQRQIIELLAKLGRSFAGSDVRPASQRFAAPFDPSLLLYRRPTCQMSETAYSDLLQWAPGLNTTREDRAALIESESGPAQRLAPGHVDAGARELIDRARQGGWQRVTLAGEGSTTFDLILDGSGRYVCEHRVGLGLLERTICDGKTVFQLYPEIGIGAKREMSRIYRAQLTRLVPWALPPTDDLACGADVRQVDPLTVEISTPGASKAPATSQPTLENRSVIRLIFAPEGRLAARQLIGGASRKCLNAESYDTNGRVTSRQTDGSEKLLMDLKCKPADPPDLLPHDQSLVVLPMPWLTRPAAHSDAIDNKPYADWSEDEALRVIAADVAAHDEEAASVIAWRFFRRGDRRIGFHTLMLAGQIDWGKWAVQRWGTHRTVAMGVTSGDTTQSLAAYLYWQWTLLDRSGTVEAPKAAANGGDFFRRLLEMRAIAADSKGDSPAAAQRKTFDRALAFIRECPDTACAWNVYALIAPAPAKGDESRLLAAALERFTHVPALEYSARYERACHILRAGDAAAARVQFEALYRDSIDRGLLPPVDSEFRIALAGGATSQPASGGTLARLLHDACDKLRQRRQPGGAGRVVAGLGTGGCSARQ